MILQLYNPIELRIHCSFPLGVYFEFPPSSSDQWPRRKSKSQRYLITDKDQYSKTKWVLASTTSEYYLIDKEFRQLESQWKKHLCSKTGISITPHANQVITGSQFRTTKPLVIHDLILKFKKYLSSFAKNYILSLLYPDDCQRAVVSQGQCQRKIVSNEVKQARKNLFKTIVIRERD